MSQPITTQTIDDGAWWRVTLGGSKGNILDGELMDGLGDVFSEARQTRHLKAIVLEGAGDHFSFGASVQEHLPGQVEGMIGRFGRLLCSVVDSSVVVLAAVRGQCLGGALELVTLSHRIFANVNAKFGQPEISLGVFALAASVLLPRRIPRAHAEDLCLTGRIIGSREALALGLVNEVVEGDPADAALGWARTHLATKSASTLRLAARALRGDLAVALGTDLRSVERLYLNELMQSADAAEGLHAFLEKRPPGWRDA